MSPKKTDLEIEKNWAGLEKSNTQAKKLIFDRKIDFDSKGPFKQTEKDDSFLHFL